MHIFRIILYHNNTYMYVTIHNYICTSKFYKTFTLFNICYYTSYYDFVIID
jgi:hypothetical protein